MDTFEIYIGISFKKVIESNDKTAIGVGGYGAVVTSQGKTVRVLSNGFVHTKDARLNLLAISDILNALKPPALIYVYLPNGYIEDSITLKRLNRWVESGGISSRPNNDLWLKVYNSLQVEGLDIYFRRLNGVKSSWQAKRAKTLSHIASQKNDKLVDLQAPPAKQMTLFD